MSELAQLQQYFAEDLQLFYQQRQDLESGFTDDSRNMTLDTVITQTQPEKLNDPAISLFPAFEQALCSIKYYTYKPKLEAYGCVSKQALESSSNFAYNVYLRFNAALAHHKWSKADNFDEQADGSVKHYAALQALKVKTELHEEPLEQLYSLTTIGIIAALHKPESFVTAGKPKKHKGETEDDIVFRKAVTYLWETAYPQRLRSETKFFAQHDLTERLALYLEKSDAGNEARLYNQRWAKSNLAKSLLEMLTRPGFTAESVGVEFDEQLIRDEHAREIASTLPIKETHWTILPPGALLGDNDDNDIATNLGEKVSFVDPSRLKWLARTALDWDPHNSYIAIANLEKTGDYDYRVAVLPQIINGVPVEHAIAENPHSNNSAFVFRAERGLDGQDIWLTWKDVLNGDKNSAVMLGARRIVHKIFFQENVIEYITRPTKDLDKAGYKR